MISVAKLSNKLKIINPQNTIEFNFFYKVKSKRFLANKEDYNASTKKIKICDYLILFPFFIIIAILIYTFYYFPRNSGSIVPLKNLLFEFCYRSMIYR